MTKHGEVIAVVGTQFGDEGKGRFIDNLIESENISVVARFNGGPNAGHRIVVDGRAVSLHVVPSGIFHKNTVNIIGDGTVINPVKLVAEFDDVRSTGNGVTADNLRISNNAHVILPSYIIEDTATNAHIGTTKQGIGPAYIRKVDRKGVRASAFADPASYGELVRQKLEEALNLYGGDCQKWFEKDIDEVVHESIQAAKQLAPFVSDTGTYLRDILRSGKSVLAEGAQATLLDINHGTYPFVTSSSATSAGVSPGLGVPPTAIKKVFGVAKLTMSRVGEGPFPTEIMDETLAAKMRGSKDAIDGEYGGTTGRSRRIGWMDAVALRYAVELNGITQLGVTKLDCLSGYDELKIATGYAHKGVQLDSFSTDPDVLSECEAQYETLPGWSQKLSDIKNYDQLPDNAKTYISRLEQLGGAPITMIGVGPGRDHMIFR